ncbi:hypothetical protein LTR62_005765 [Meristemomyces frigidus]|uniref:Dihydroneopterin aldolase/epimerase domain-containing protein n=1 Tax=Meristemomyces frigidus TaxID=1508187 RepID=A0AAN7YJ19_9PEZI|nr:hypothetical protein LTR62_005765 [Meristemomyces frigidus]
MTPLPAGDHDAIHLRALQPPHGVLAPDIWSKQKDQPVLLNLKLSLHNPFSSAASKDELDNSTIHYGHLAKNIRAASRQHQTLPGLFAAAREVVERMGMKGSRAIIATSEIEVELPKASMHGDLASIALTTDYDERGQALQTEMEFRLRGVKIMTLVGVNAYERGARQPVVANLGITVASTLGDGEIDALLGVEGRVVRVRVHPFHSLTPFLDRVTGLTEDLRQIIQDTEFETLESLADYTVKTLQSEMLSEQFPGSRVGLRLEKPRAIAFADAPAVEVLRTTPGRPSGDVLMARSKPSLQIIKPYS